MEWREGASGRFGTWKSETPLVPKQPVSTNTQPSIAHALGKQRNQGRMSLPIRFQTAIPRSVALPCALGMPVSLCLLGGYRYRGAVPMRLSK